MNKYELTVVFKPNLSEDDFNNEFDKLKDLVEKSGATIEKIDQWGKKRLAYEIQKFNEGFYNFIIFTASPNVPSELEAKLRIMENVLRYLIVRQEN